MAIKEQRRGWPVNFEVLRTPPESVSAIITVAGLVLFGALLFIATLALGWLLVDLAGGEQRRGAEAAKTALPIVGAAIGLPLLVWRLLILNRQTRISEDKTQIDRETHYTSIFSRSIEQLGQTREVKRTIQAEDASLDTTTTVPNIEVRLGGIHSLSRLAAESARDQRTIENIFRSYVRENSWSDRNGQTANKLSWNVNTPWQWVYGYQRTNPEKKWVDAYNGWKKSVETQNQKNKEWADSLSETRVDVNEAVDAIQLLLKESEKDGRPILYECLFVGRKFAPEILSQVKFHRCVFVRCEFDAIGPSGLMIDDCQLFRCDFSSKRLEANISESFISDTDFTNVEEGTILISGCEGINVSFYSSPRKLHILQSTMHGFNMLGDDDPDDRRITTNLSLEDSVFSNSYLGSIKLTAESDLNFQVCVECKFGAVDLSDLTVFDVNKIALMEANPRTKGPTKIVRPKIFESII